MTISKNESRKFPGVAPRLLLEEEIQQRLGFNQPPYGNPIESDPIDQYSAIARRIDP
jgi:hypothetical protein